jgi:tRNA nucleotidyltransferase (CCA-adding enzyme)
MPNFFIPKTKKDLQENIHILNFALQIPKEINDFVSYIEKVGGKAFLVGGSVRDSILSAKTGIEFEMKDFDLEIFGINPSTLKTILAIKYGKVEEVGESFGVFKVKLEGLDEPVDIAVPRTDKVSLEIQKGRGVISNSDPNLDLVKAVSRRDLTINSILYDPISKKIVDPFGGWSDLMDGVIRVTDPETFIEDPLRILRVAQFASRFGFEISPDTVRLSKNLCELGGMNSLPTERIRDEFDKLLIKGYSPSIGLRFLKEIGYLDILLPEISKLSEIPQESDYHPEGDVFTHTMQVIDAMAIIIRCHSKENPFNKDLKRALMLGALFHDLGKIEKTKFDEERQRITSHGHEEAGVSPATEIIKRLYKNKEQSSDLAYEKLILFLISDHMKPLLLHKESESGVDVEKALRRFINRCYENNTTPEQLLMLVEADKLGRNSIDKSKPLALDQKPDLKIPLDWFRNSVKDISDKLALNPNEKKKSLLNISVFLSQERCKNLRPGPWVQVINRCVYLDYVDGLVSNKSEALNRANFYFDLIFKGSDYKNLIENRVFWAKFKVQDPREIF